MRPLALTLAALAVAAPLAAQDAPQKGAALPAGWHARLDRPGMSMDDVKLVTMGDGLHATMGRANAIFYSPAVEAKGAYRVKATFTQTKSPPHPEAYGLFVGGMNLDAENQDYLYFLVRETGQFLIKHRAGSDVHTIMNWTAHDAVAKKDDAGKATNTLAIEADGRGARFLVNGVRVFEIDRAQVPYLNTDGLAGLRVNMHLDVHIAGFAVEPLSDASVGR